MEVADVGVSKSMPSMTAFEVAASVNEIKRRLNKELNDAHVFASVISPLLDAHAFDIGVELQKIPETFDVPIACGDLSQVKRTSDEVAALITKFVSRELIENLLLSSISRTEAVIGDVLRVLIRADNDLLRPGNSGPGDGKVRLDDVLQTTSKEELIERLIDEKVRGVFYAKPSDYLKYVRRIAEVPISDGPFLAFCEAKATRDIIVHNGGKANEQYTEKAGALARAKSGESLVVDKAYLSGCIVAMKAILQDISDGLEAKANKGL